MLPLLIFMFLPASRERQNTQQKGNIFYSPRKILFVFSNFSCSCGTYIYFPAEKEKFPYRADAIQKLFPSYSQPHHPDLDISCHEDISKDKLDSNTGPSSQ
jgi:hypothetical protein